MNPDEPRIAELDENQCWELLRQNSLGRLATSAGGELDIFPVNYVVDGATVLFRTAPGTKLVELTIHHAVVLETDGFSDSEAWSVVLKGDAAKLDSQREIDEADRLPLTPWIPTLKYVWVRITPRQVTGRRFDRAPEPERYPL